MEFRPIGIIHTPNMSSSGTPIQGQLSPIEGEIEVFPEFEEGLSDVEAFSHLIILYVFDRAKQAELKVTPYLDTQQRGLFACRAPARPNPIGLTVVRLREKRGRTLHVEGVDMLDGSPLLDIKPYVPDFDSIPHATRGWLADRLDRPGKSVDADDRFSET